MSARVPHVAKPIDLLTKKAGQLSAMLETAHGAGFASFNAYNDSTKENYLWACADLAAEINALAAQLEVGMLSELAAHP